MLNQSTTAPSCKDSSKNPSLSNTIAGATSQRSQQITLNIPWGLAVLAGCIFTAASGLTNVIYALGKSPELSQQALWCSVAVAASLTLATSPSAIIAACKRQAYSAAILAALAFILCGAYSLSGALGSAVGVRAMADATSSDTEGRRARAKDEYGRAERDLAALPTARPAAELEPLIVKLKATPGANDCQKVDGTISRKVCGQVAELEAEKARDLRRAELQDKMQVASEALANLGAPKPVNTDAAALATYLAMAGLDVSASDLNKWLALLAVALVEFGGGLSFAMASTFARDLVVPNVEHQTPVWKPVSVTPCATHSEPMEQVEHSADPNDPQTVDFLELAARAKGGTLPRRKLTVADDLSCRMVELLETHGTELLGSNRTFGKALGISHTQAGRVIDQLQARGVVTVTRGKGGTVVRLAAA